PGGPWRGPGATRAGTGRRSPARARRPPSERVPRTSSRRLRRPGRRESPVTPGRRRARLRPRRAGTGDSVSSFLREKVPDAIPDDRPMTLILILAGLVLAGFLIDRLLLWMEWRGGIDYRRTYPGRLHPGQVGAPFRR